MFRNVFNSNSVKIKTVDKVWVGEMGVDKLGVDKVGVDKMCNGQSGNKPSCSSFFVGCKPMSNVIALSCFIVFADSQN